MLRQLFHLVHNRRGRARAFNQIYLFKGKILFPHVMAGSSVVTDEHMRSLCFGDFMHPEVEKKLYDEIPDVTLLTKAMEHYLKEYNAVSKAPMPLVMFRYAVEHTSRINRIIRQRGGHALLVGLGGSGRQSLARLATFIARYQLFQIEVNKTYGVAAWRNDLKKVLKMAGADGKQVVFLFNDMQIKDEAFLEDISMVLNTGEVPNLFPPEEKAEILDRVQATARADNRDLGGEGSFANLYNLFLQNIKSNLHVVLCMSPIGAAFRNRLRSVAEHMRISPPFRWRLHSPKKERGESEEEVGRLLPIYPATFSFRPSGGGSRQKLIDKWVAVPSPSPSWPRSAAGCD